MKKIFFMLALAFLQVCYSQNEGRFILTGDLNFNKRAFDHYEFDSDEETTFSTSIKAGYILLDSNLEIGLGFAFSSSNDNFSDENFEIISTLIYANQYFPLTDRFALNISGEFSYSKSYYRDRDDFDQKTYILEFRPGCIYFVSKRIGLTANYGSVGFNTSKFRQTSGDSSINNIYFNFNPSSIPLGLAFLL